MSGALVWQWTVAFESDIAEEQGHGKLAFKIFFSDSVQLGDLFILLLVILQLLKVSLVL